MFLASFVLWKNAEVKVCYEEPFAGLHVKFFNYYPNALNDNTLQSGLFFLTQKLKEVVLHIQKDEKKDSDTEKSC